MFFSTLNRKQIYDVQALGRNSTTMCIFVSIQSYGVMDFLNKVALHYTPVHPRTFSATWSI